MHLCRIQICFVPKTEGTGCNMCMTWLCHGNKKNLLQVQCLFLKLDNNMGFPTKNQSSNKNGKKEVL